MSKKSILTTIFALAATIGWASLVAAAGDGHGASREVLLKDFIYRAINFAVMAGVIYYFVAKHFKKAMADRRQKVETDLHEARTARAEAEAKYQEVTLRLQKASEDIEEVRLSIQREGDAEREKIIANAQKAVEKIHLEADKMATLEIARARSELHQEASRLAITLARELIKKNINAEDQERFVTEYLKNVGEFH